MTDAPQSAGLVALAERIELWPIDRLRPYERNPRTHSEGQVDQIAASMVEFGWTNPILVDENAGILAGHGRLLAARKLGLTEVPVIRFEHLSEAQKRAYILADNQIALQAGWDDALLAEELAWLRDESFELDLIGFDATKLEHLLALADRDAAPDSAEDEVPEPPDDPVSQRGNLWLLGSHRVLCGDATVLADVERVLGGELADMTFTDSPYNVDYAHSPRGRCAAVGLAATGAGGGCGGTGAPADALARSAGVAAGHRGLPRSAYDLAGSATAVLRRRRRARSRGGVDPFPLRLGDDPVGGRAAPCSGLVWADLAGAGRLDGEPELLLERAGDGAADGVMLGPGSR